MDFAPRHNLAIDAIRAERFGPEALLAEAVARGRSTLDGPLLPGRPDGDAAQACNRGADCEHTAVWSTGDAYEPSCPAAPDTSPPHPDPPAEFPPTGVESLGLAAPPGSLLDVFA